MSGFKTEAMASMLGSDKSSTEGTLEHRFEADEWRRLTIEQRIRRCHRMAEQAQELAKAAPTEIAETYLRIAKDWLRLAMEMQNASLRPESTRSPSV